MTDALIISTAFTGADSDNNRNPAVPFSTQEIRTDAIACTKLGTGMDHFQGLEGDRSHSCNAGHYGGATLNKPWRRQELRLPAYLLALSCAPDVRTRLEGNLEPAKGQMDTSTTLGQRITELADLSLRPIASQTKLRQMPGLGDAW